MQESDYTLYIIDDHPIVIEGISHLLMMLESNIQVSGYAVSLKQALSERLDYTPDIILLDLYLGTSNPVDNFKKIRIKFPRSIIIIYSVETSILWKVRMIKEGAYGYITKNESFDVVRNTFDEALRGNIVVPQNIIQLLKEPCNLFSAFELEIITDLAVQTPIKMIATRLDRSKSLIEKKINGLRRKLNARNNSELLIQANRIIDNIDVTKVSAS